MSSPSYSSGRQDVLRGVGTPTLARPRWDLQPVRGRAVTLAGAQRVDADRFSEVGIEPCSPPRVWCGRRRSAAIQPGACGSDMCVVFSRVVLGSLAQLHDAGHGDQDGRPQDGLFPCMEKRSTDNVDGARREQRSTSVDSRRSFDAVSPLTLGGQGESRKGLRKRVLRPGEAWVRTLRHLLV